MVSSLRVLQLIAVFCCLAVVVSAVERRHIVDEDEEDFGSSMRFRSHRSDVHNDEQSSHDANEELLSTLHSLLKERKARDLHAQQKLQDAAQHTLLVETELAQRTKQLSKHSQMLTRLESCLKSGPPEDKLLAREKDLAAKEKAVNEKDQQLSAKASQFASSQSTLKSQQQQLQTLTATLSKKESELKSQSEALNKRESELKKSEEELHAKESTLLKHVNELTKAGESMKEKIQTSVQTQVAAIKKDLEAREAAKLAKLQSAVTKSVSLLAMKAKAEIKQVSSQKEQEAMSFVESKEFVVHSTQARKCISYTGCDTCSADPGCAWCSSANGGAGACLLHDVNASLRPGFSGKGDGLTSGQCTSQNWQSSVTGRLTLLSYNVFSGERTNGARRLASIVKLMRQTGADVIGLQEVEKWFVQTLQAHQWVKDNYHFSDFGPGQAPGGLYILSRYPITDLAYYEAIHPGQTQVAQRGRVLVAKLSVKNQPVHVAVTTLDWQSAENRAASMDYIFNVVSQYNDVIMLGDFNFDDGAQPETSHIPSGYLDLWPTLVKNNPGYTWDPRFNSFAKASDPLSRPSRIDRILLKSTQWLPRNIHIVGCSVGDLICAGRAGTGNQIGNNTRVGVVSTNIDTVGPSIIINDPNPHNNELVNLNINNNPAMVKPSSFVELDDIIVPTPKVAVAADPFADQSYDPDFTPSNHYGLLLQVSRFSPHC